ncbi:MAG: glycosyltransferase family 2 protein, partial [Pyrinomonadaceae bacterium]|nr:glycosyltransferase family 2 protein [Sphingobacteriaceae bacterium]
MEEKSDSLVSVIISFLNEEAYLPEAIESVIFQSYTHWELILVDDGSTDQSTDIARKYAEKYPGKILYTEHQGHSNKGLSFSRNHGIALAKGELIAVLDADDVWLKDKLTMQVDLMRSNPQAAMLCEASEFWYHNWHNQAKQNVIKQIGKEQDKLFKPLELVKQVYPLSNGYAPCPSGIIVKREVLLKLGGFEAHFSGKYQLYEDQALLHKIYLNEYVYISSLCNHRYRQRETSLVRKIKGEGDYHVVRQYFLEWLEQYIIVNNFKQKVLHKLLKRAFEPYRQ